MPMFSPSRTTECPRRATWLPLTLALTVFLAGCASSQTAERHPDDPWEGFNRRVFVFNDVLDRYALKPVARGYRAITPDPVESSVGNFFANLLEPRTVVNSVLQGKGRNASLATSRFLINSTVGVGGLFDVASRMEITGDEEDFGQTLAVWGWRDSRYLMLPLLGPSTLRDTAGLPADRATDPVMYLDDETLETALMVLDVVDTRAGLLDREEMIQGDRYRFIRDAYLQSREFDINDGELGNDPFATDDFEFDDADFDDPDIDENSAG